MRWLWVYLAVVAACPGHYSRGQAWLAQARQEPDPAARLALYEAEAARQPGDLVYFYMTTTLIELSRYRQALQCAQQGLDVPGCRYAADLYAQQARAYYQLGEQGSAIQAAQQCLALQPRHTTAYNILGLAYMATQSYPEALQALEVYVSLKPDSDYAYYLRHLVHYRMQQYEAALADIEQAMALSPEGAEEDKTYLERKVLTLNELGRGEETRQLMGRLVDPAGSDPASLTNLGNSYYQNGQYLQAMGYLNHAQAEVRRLEQQDPRYTDLNRELVHQVYLSRGNACMMLNDYEQALLDLSLARDLMPEDYRAYARLGELHIQLEHWEEAVLNYELCFRYKPDYPAGWVNYGFAWGRLGEDHRSLEVYSQALQNPDVESRALILNNRGFTMLESGHMRESKADLEAAIAEDPYMAMGYVSLGEWYLGQAAYVDAIARFDQALQQPEPGQREKYTAYLKRGMAYQALKKPEQAKSDYEQALAIDPTDVQAYEQLGLLYYEQKDLCTAKRFLTRAVEEDRRNPYRQEAKAARLYLLFIEKSVNSPCL